MTRIFKMLTIIKRFLSLWQPLRAKLNRRITTMPVRDSAALREILTSAKVIAVVGHSDNPRRTSYQIGRTLIELGYTVYPVNPNVAEIDGKPCYASLAAVPEGVDIVNVFRRSEYLLEVVDEAIQIGAKVVWAQLGVYDDRA